MIRASIILTCFKEGLYLREAIESAVRQMNSGVELILVNDASPDPETNKICAEAAKRGLTVLTHMGNRGLSAARNTAIQRMRGEICLFLDGDDRLPDGAVSAAIEFLDQNKECDFVCGDYVKINEQGEPLGKVSMAPIFRGSYMAPDLLMSNWILSGTSPVRRSLLERLGGFDESPWLSNGPQDIDFYQRVLSTGAKGGRLDRIMYFWRMHSLNMHQTQGRVTYDLLSLKNRKILAAISGISERQIISGALHGIYAHGDISSFRRFYHVLFAKAGWKNHVRFAGILAGLRVGRPQSSSRAVLSPDEIRHILSGTTAPQVPKLLISSKIK